MKIEQFLIGKEIETETHRHRGVVLEAERRAECDTEYYNAYLVKYRPQNEHFPKYTTMYLNNN